MNKPLANIAENGIKIPPQMQKWRDFVIIPNFP